MFHFSLENKMAHIATIKILVNENDMEQVYDLLYRVLNPVFSVWSDDSSQGKIVDWGFDSVNKTNDSIKESIANKTYKKGNAFASWVLFSPREAYESGGEGFWSSRYGWTERESATHFDACGRGYEKATDAPINPRKDAEWILAKSTVHSFRLFVRGPNDKVPVAFECYAPDYGHAVMQAKKAYPDCEVI
jgi:hypothetical protein